jgi:hypothetical protein
LKASNPDAAVTLLRHQNRRSAHLIAHASDDHCWRHGVSACHINLEATTEVAVAHIVACGAWRRGARYPCLECRGIAGTSRGENRPARHRVAEARVPRLGGRNRIADASPTKVRFAFDSPLGQAGFEPLVPLREPCDGIGRDRDRWKASSDGQISWRVALVRRRFPEKRGPAGDDQGTSVLEIQFFGISCYYVLVAPIGVSPGAETAMRSRRRS